MKPVSVRFKCFGPYMDEQFIDFEELEKNGLFLICGETGAGKTTILDAICYALYGESSGGQRGDLESMRCKMAEKGDETAVEFIFTSNGRRYKFSRSMKYKTVKLHTYHTSYVWNGETWEVLDSLAGKVAARAQKIVGLTSSQFRQVIILPQGKFEEFLVSNSDKKEEILATLFDVQQWKRIAEEINRRVNDRAATLNQEKIAIAEGLRRYDCSSIEALAAKRTELETSLAQTGMQAQQAKKELEDAEKAYSAAKLDSELFASLTRMKNRFAQLQEKAEAMAQEAVLLTRADRAELLVPIHGEYRNAAAAKNKAENDEKSAKKRLETGETAFSQAKMQLEEHEAQKTCHGENQKLLLKLEQAREVYASLEGLNAEALSAQRKCAAAQKTLKNQTDELSGRERELTGAFDAQKQAQADYEAAQTAYRRSIGGILAETLEEGKRCPVCGSLEHPDPAKKSADHVSEAQLDKLNKTLAQWADKVSAAMTARVRAEKARNDAQEVFNRAEQNLNTIRQRLNLAREQRIEGIETGEELENQIRGLKLAIQKYEDQGRKLLNAKTGAEAACSAAEIALADCKALLEEALQTLNARTQAWEQALEASIFDTEKDFLAACLAPEQKQKRYQALTDWRADVKAAEEALAEQQELLNGREKPDLEGLKQRRDQTEQDFHALSERQLLDGRLLKEMSSDEKKLSTRLEASREALITLEADKVFAKRLMGSHGVGLQRYVLGVMMNSVTAQANRLLENVYGGRYRLHRTDESSDRSMKSGLELEVFDSHNSQRRSVRTLSGGEKFLVALSLAIGLSTVVQAQGEGIRLEAMFIDEGFGSLDREAIQDALDILQGIRSTAGVVGIISHVEALAETIPTRIEITKGRRGSTAHVSV